MPVLAAAPLLASPDAVGCSGDMGAPGGGLAGGGEVGGHAGGWEESLGGDSERVEGGEWNSGGLESVGVMGDVVAGGEGGEDAEDFACAPSLKERRLLLDGALDIVSKEASKIRLFT